MSRHMVDYRRMVRVEQRLVYATPTTPLVYQHNDDLWRSPRGTVLRIQSLALVAITLSFFLAVFGSCRRWSNRWIVKKGFSAAQVLSLSLGTYSIGLMQSSSVKSELYPVWAVSLLSLLGCVDPVTTYIGLDYKGPLLKVIFQLCLYGGYVLLMSASTISGVFGNIAIGVLSAITFIKGFHRSLALVLPSRMRNKLREIDEHTECGALESGGQQLVVHLPVHRSEKKVFRDITMLGIRASFKDMTDDESHKKTNSTIENNSYKKTNNNTMENDIHETTNSTIENVCLGYSLSHLLRRRFLGMNTASQMVETRKKFKKRPKSWRSYVKTLKAVEVELAFLYEVFFTSNEFLHYYEAKTSSFWALASFVGICLVGIAVAIPGTMASRYYHRSSTTYTTTGLDVATSVAVVVNTTTADLAITLVILASLALLQLVQLMGCWTSNWARVAFACECERNRMGEQQPNANDPSRNKAQFGWTTSLKAFVVTRMNWFDNYLWQDKLGQYSAVAASAKSWREEGYCIPIANNQLGTCVNNEHCEASLSWVADLLAEMLGLQYIKQAVEDLLWSTNTKGGAGIRLHNDVKTCIAEFLGQMKSPRIWEERSPLFDAGNVLDDLLKYHPCRPVPPGHTANTTPAAAADDDKNSNKKSETFLFTFHVMVWHIATWYCQESEESGQGGGGGGGGSGCCSSSRDNSNTDNNKNRRVAIALSKYCAYLVVSAPELLPGPSKETKKAFDRAASQTSEVARYARIGLSAIIREASIRYNEEMMPDDAFWKGVHCGKRLRKDTPKPKPKPPPPDGHTSRCDSADTSYDHWKVLADLWVQTLLYAAPYGDLEAHMQHLSQGGEFITHLWALLYHIGIVDGWETETAPRDQQTTPGMGSSNTRGKQKQ